MTTEYRIGVKTKNLQSIFDDIKNEGLKDINIVIEKNVIFFPSVLQVFNSPKIRITGEGEGNTRPKLTFTSTKNGIEIIGKLHSLSIKNIIFAGVGQMGKNCGICVNTTYDYAHVITIEGCDIEGCGYGIKLIGNKAFNMRNVRISDNRISNINSSKGVGIYLEHIHSVKIDGNLITNVETGVSSNSCGIMCNQSVGLFSCSMNIISRVEGNCIITYASSNDIQLNVLDTCYSGGLVIGDRVPNASFINNNISNVIISRYGGKHNSPAYAIKEISKGNTTYSNILAIQTLKGSLAPPVVPFLYTEENNIPTLNSWNDMTFLRIGPYEGTDFIGMVHRNGEELVDGTDLIKEVHTVLETHKEIDIVSTILSEIDSIKHKDVKKTLRKIFRKWRDYSDAKKSLRVQM